MKRVCYQINLQQGIGGGEIYTRFFSRALAALGWENVLFVHRRAHFWREANIPGTRFVPVERYVDIAAHIPAEPALIVTHAPALGSLGEQLRQKHFLVTFAHMPLYGRSSAPFQAVDLVFAVSGHVIGSLKDAGIQHYYPEPLYGVADLERGSVSDVPIRASSIYEWDKRKVRDRVLSALHPLFSRLRPSHIFKRRPGLTLGIVSRLTPIKQLPQMFEILAPILHKFPQVSLEIFGSGGYASVRDLRHALAPIRAQTRFWGAQSDVRSVYRELDFLLTGLPEKEALGLNVLEAQFCGTPVLAINAPPFTETVAEGDTGLFFTDPRQDGGQDFERLLTRLATGYPHPHPAPTGPHLEKFTFPCFKERVARAMKFAVESMQQRRNTPEQGL